MIYLVKDTISLEILVSYINPNKWYTNKANTHIDWLESTLLEKGTYLFPPVKQRERCDVFSPTKEDINQNTPLESNQWGLDRNHFSACATLTKTCVQSGSPQTNNLTSAGHTYRRKACNWCSSPQSDQIDFFKNRNYIQV